MRQKHAHLVAVVDPIVALDQIVDVAIGTIVGEMSTIIHARWASEVLVVAGFCARLLAAHGQKVRVVDIIR